MMGAGPYVADHLGERSRRNSGPAKEEHLQQFHPVASSNNSPPFQNPAFYGTQVAYKHSPSRYVDLFGLDASLLSLVVILVPWRVAESQA